MAAPETRRNVIAATDLSKWRLKNERGRQTWWYDADGVFDRDSNFLERHSLGLDTVSINLYACRSTYIFQKAQSHTLSTLVKHIH